MKLRNWAIGVVSCSPLGASAEIKGYPDGPKLPNVSYSVHDPARPQPPAVKTGGAISVKPPSDAIILFDGTSLDAWSPGFILRDGIMVAAEKDAETKQSFGAVQVHIEWRLPANRPVDAQKGGNSGIFMMGLYEVQILQSHLNPTYPDGQAGAMYGQLPPLVNATSPQGEWQSYDITFVPPVYDGEKVMTPAKLTLFHNGICVQNGESYIGPTQHINLATYPQTHPLTAPISLQFHQDPMEFRNIWVRPLGTRP
jgi:Domain of Unknown Function (DUF1080)